MIPTYHNDFKKFTIAMDSLKAYNSGIIRVFKLKDVKKILLNSFKGRNWTTFKSSINTI